jgi:hypothetical protein
MGFFDDEAILRAERDNVLCTSHFADTGLADQLLASERGKCFACGSDDEVARIPMWQLLAECQRIIEHHFEPQTDADSHTYRTSAVVQNVFGREVFDDSSELRISLWLSEELEGSHWRDRDDHFNHFSPNAGWTAFREVVEHTSRAAFLHRNSSSVLQGNEALDFVDRFLTIVRDRVPSSELEIETKVYRGRLVSDQTAHVLSEPSAMINGLPSWLQKEYLSASSLGAAPAHKASVSRYSPAGIPMFYASPKPETAMAEIAAHDYTRDYAIIGEFRTVRRLKLLNFIQLDSLVPSVADVERSSERKELKFLLDFVRDVTRPIKPDGREHIDYAATQLIAELIRFAPSLQVHGMALPSAQAGRQPTWVFFMGAEAASNVATSGNYDEEVAFALDPAEDWHLRKVTRELPSAEMVRGFSYTPLLQGKQT